MPNNAGCFIKINIALPVQLIFKLFILILSTSLNAGPPFLTGNPGLAAYNHYELYLYAILVKNPIALLEPDLLAPTVEIDWVILPNVKVFASVPYAWSLPNAAPFAHGVGDTQLGFVRRILAETKYIPETAIIPDLIIPTGNAQHNLGNGQPWVQVPIWMQKTWKKWKAYGGGGYAINPAPGLFNYFFAGGVLEHQLTEHLALGGELFYQTPPAIDSTGVLFINVGGIYDLTKNFSLLFSIGHSVVGTTNIITYLGINWRDPVSLHPNAKFHLTK